MPLLSTLLIFAVTSVAAQQDAPPPDTLLSELLALPDASARIEYLRSALADVDDKEQRLRIMTVLAVTSELDSKGCTDPERVGDLLERALSPDPLVRRVAIETSRGADACVVGGSPPLQVEDGPEGVDQDEEMDPVAFPSRPEGDEPSADPLKDVPEAEDYAVEAVLHLVPGELPRPDRDRIDHYDTGPDQGFCLEAYALGHVTDDFGIRLGLSGRAWLLDVGIEHYRIGTYGGFAILFGARLLQIRDVFTGSIWLRGQGSDLVIYHGPKSGLGFTVDTGLPGRWAYWNHALRFSMSFTPVDERYVEVGYALRFRP